MQLGAKNSKSPLDNRNTGNALFSNDSPLQAMQYLNQSLLQFADVIDPFSDRC